jgi:hypothetical protein
MKLTYVLAGWEGSAHDGRLLRDAVRPNRVDKLIVPSGMTKFYKINFFIYYSINNKILYSYFNVGKYYLVDAGFPNVPGFLAPYRGTRYHLKDQVGHAPKNGKELFNYRHSSLRNVVERTIGLLKKRFSYLRHSPFYDIQTQSKVILACCTLHNFLREVDPEDLCEGDEDVDEDDQYDNLQEDSVVIQPSPTWIAKRDALAELMWNEYNLP